MSPMSNTCVVVSRDVASACIVTEESLMVLWHTKKNAFYTQKSDHTIVYHDLFNYGTTNKRALVRQSIRIANQTFFFLSQHLSMKEDLSKNPSNTLQEGNHNAISFYHRFLV